MSFEVDSFRVSADIHPTQDSRRSDLRSHVPSAGHNHDVENSRAECFLDNILNCRLADDREHFLGLGFRIRQEVRAETGSRDDGLHTGDSNIIGFHNFLHKVIAPGNGAGY